MLRHRDFAPYLELALERAAAASGIARESFAVTAEGVGDYVDSATIAVGGNTRTYGIERDDWAGVFVEDAAAGLFGMPRVSWDLVS